MLYSSLISDLSQFFAPSNNKSNLKNFAFKTKKLFKPNSFSRYFKTSTSIEESSKTLINALV